MSSAPRRALHHARTDALPLPNHLVVLTVGSQTECRLDTTSHGLILELVTVCRQKTSKQVLRPIGFIPANNRIAGI
jgi:hypothetical protein